MLEPEVLGVPERQIHVLHRRPRRSLEQIVHRREQQELACPPVHRRGEPRPIGVGHVRNVRRLLPRLDEAPPLVILRVPAENLLRFGKLPGILELHHDGLELATADGKQVRYEGYLRRLPYPPEHDLYLRRVPVAWRTACDPVGRDALIDRHEVGLDARLGPRPAHPRERVYRDGAHPQPLCHRREREYRRRRITTWVRDQPSLRRPEDLR